MSPEAGAAEGSGEPPSRWPLVWREVRRQTAYLVLVAMIVIGLALALGAIAASLQAGRDEVRSADLAIVVVPAIPSQALADHIFELHRRGFAPRVVLIGEGGEGLRVTLIERGVRDDAVVHTGNNEGELVALREMAQEAQAAGARSALVVTVPEAELLGLKLVQDQGLRAYGAPAPGRPDPVGIVWASARYWQYVLGLG